MSLENIIDRDFEKLDQEFYDYVAEKMAQAVQSCGNSVPVVTGKKQMFMWFSQNTEIIL